MKTIAYYVSDYGYGHGTRSIAIMRQLLKHNVRIIVSTSFPMPIIKAAFPPKEQPVGSMAFRYNENDLGFITKPSSIDINLEEMNRQYAKYAESFDERVRVEEQFLQKNKVDLVLSDISSAPFVAAKNQSIPSIGISNFTWYTAYLQIIEEAKLATLKKAYESMDYFFALAAANERSWPRLETKNYDFFARDVDPKKCEGLLKLHNPNGEYMLVYFGLGMKIDVDQLRDFPLLRAKNIKLIVSSNLNWTGENIISIPADEAETQYYVAIANLVITKPGWGTVGEAVCYNKPLLLLNRSNMQEDENTINYLAPRNRCMVITWEELSGFHLTEEIWKQFNQQVSGDYAGSEAHRIAEDIMKLL